MQRPRTWVIVGAATVGVVVVGLALRRRQTRSWLPRSVGPVRRACVKVVPAASIGAVQGMLTVLPKDYPQVRRDDSVVETLHGVQIADPYRFLEDPDADETREFVAAQNALTNKVLDCCPTRKQFEQLFRELYNYPKFSCPFKRGSRFYYMHNTGLQPQSVMYTQATLDAEPSVLLDPNTLSSDGTVALMSRSFSKDGRYLAYSLSSGGSDWRVIKVMTITEDGKGCDSEAPVDTLERVKFSSIAWTHDHKGFFYQRYPVSQQRQDGTETEINLNQQLYYHTVGTAQSQDVYLFAVPQPDWLMSTEVTHDGRYLLISMSAGCEPVNQLWYLPLAGLADWSAYDLNLMAGGKQLPLVKLVDNFDAQWEYIANEGSWFTLQTNSNAPRYRLVQGDLSTGDPAAWVDLIPQHESDVLQWANALQGDALVVCWLHNVSSLVELRSLKTGAVTYPIRLPGLGSVTEFSGRREDTQAFLAFSSFTEPNAIYMLDVTQPSPQLKLYRRTQLKGYDPDHFHTVQAFATSKDGTRVPMFITSRKGLKLDGQNPTLLYGYGGFNISLEPGFSPSRLAFMMAYDGVYVVANLRGGGEFGREWRDAGSCHNKQNVFDDFQACASSLIAQGYTQPGKLTIQGGSNGGLLVAACANQRPDLFGCVIGQVGVMDMLRFHKFTIGHAWVTDYGSADNPEDFAVLLQYSPLHNVRLPAEGKGQYPAMILTTGDHDDRVVPLHTLKLLAQLQHVLAGKPICPQRNPVLARIEVRAGHGAGRPTEKIIAETADVYGFAAAVMGATWRGPGSSL